MIEGWKEVKLGDVSTKIGDGLHGTPKYDEFGEYYFINGNNLENGKVIIKPDTKRISTDEYLAIKKELSDRTLMVGINGTLGNIGVYNGEKIALGKSACYINLINEVDKQFIRYVLVHQHFQNYAVLFATGSTIKNLGLKAIRNYKINLPPLPTQRKIASILSAYDDLIENNLKRIKLLEEKAQLTYEEWFVRLKFPGHENTPINQETGLPEGWEKKKIGKVMNVLSSKRIFLSDYVEEGVPFYRSKEIILKSKNESLNDRLYISREKFEDVDSKHGSPKQGDILVTAVGTLGYPYLVTSSDGEFYFKDGNLIWFKKSDEISSLYLISCFKDRSFKLMLDNIAIGSSQKALTIKALKDVKILVPSHNIAIAYDDLLSPILLAVETFQNKNQRLKEARDILLPRLMTGMIDVDSLELPTTNQEV